MNKLVKLGIYTKENNPFAGTQPTNFKKTFIYPDSGNVRFQIRLDKNGQIFDIRRSFAQIIKDEETKKRFVKVTLGERPRLLFDYVKGRPFMNAVERINLVVEQIEAKEAAE